MFRHYYMGSQLKRTQFRFQAKSSTNSRNKNPNLSSSKKQRLWIREQEFNRDEDEEEEDDDEEETSISGDESSFLSLSVKPDRSMALLDDYEMEELDYSSNPNHRSGQFSLSLSL